MGKGREEGCSHTNEPGRSCKACCGRGSIERHEFLEPGACQVGLAARVKHEAADGDGGLYGPTRGPGCFRLAALGRTGANR
jgi:hypothetical protein